MKCSNNSVVQASCSSSISSTRAGNKEEPQELGKMPTCNKALYADDLAIWHTHRHSRQSARHINLDLKRLQKYCDTWKITINTNKTSYSIFTLSPKVTKQNLNIRLSDQQLKKEEHPSYLGVQLDPRLNLKKKHAANLKRKTMKRLSLIKRLASTSWGSDMDTLRSLYLGCVRSVLDYNLCLQASSSKTVQSENHRVQNHALRFICGGMRSTPTAACEIHARIEPLGLRREKATLEMYERAQRMNPLHPAKLLVENGKKKDRIQYPTIMHHITTLQERCHL
ncbi:retrovirus-related Pol polyprotein from type-1 retrotransposable element R1 4 [Elysia marginata]|uniref:Retrovirus-related Pol polyprotein from type-1 retrotransposable element R1 4 n=1 Tax=Elysia marginata TaxID=1093978 RepID=A0AAV4IAG8_9GAST|nr:retrovirus-related Pol polyprotein from type-1 retrotransposable element R1 4 [Elysia marginata]